MGCLKHQVEFSNKPSLTCDISRKKYRQGSTESNTEVYKIYSVQKYTEWTGIGVKVYFGTYFHVQFYGLLLNTQDYAA